MGDNKTPKERKIEDDLLPQSESMPSTASVEGTNQLNQIIEPNAKEKKLNNGNDQSEIEAVAITPRQNQSADILKLNIDCLEEIFDYMSRLELYKVGVTCKRLQKVVGYFFQQNYPWLVSVSLKDEFRNLLKTDYMAEFTDLMVFQTDIDFQYFLDIQPRLNRLNRLQFMDFEFTETRIELMKKTLEKIEDLVISESVFNGTFLDRILTHCPNIKRLGIGINKNVGTNWIEQKYPKLEHFLWDINTIGLKTFLELNPNIRKFSTFPSCLWSYRYSMMASKVSLDVLVIKCIGFGEVENVSFFRLLKRLYKRGIFKQLQMEFDFTPTQKTIDQLSSLNALVKLSFRRPVENLIDLSELKDLNELRVYNSNHIIDMNALANCLTKLEQFFFEIVDINDILPLISRKANLKKIVIEKFEAGKYFNEITNIINLPALNKMRGKLFGAKKIMLYVKEDVYLATKWAYKMTDFGLIKMMRQSSYPYDRVFYF